MSVMNIYLRERESGKVVKTVAVSQEAEAERVFREISSQIGNGLNIRPDDEYNWHDHYIDADEVWNDPRHTLDD